MSSGVLRLKQSGHKGEYIKFILKSRLQEGIVLDLHRAKEISSELETTHPGKERVWKKVSERTFIIAGNVHFFHPVPPDEGASVLWRNQKKRNERKCKVIHKKKILECVALKIQLFSKIEFESLIFLKK